MNYDLTKCVGDALFCASINLSGYPHPVSRGFFVSTDLDFLGRDDTAKYKTVSAEICGEASKMLRLSPGTYQVPILLTSKNLRTMTKRIVSAVSAYVGTLLAPLSNGSALSMEGGVL